jgi:hypothetical protein
MIPYVNRLIAAINRGRFLVHLFLVDRSAYALVPISSGIVPPDFILTGMMMPLAVS